MLRTSDNYELAKGNVFVANYDAGAKLQDNEIAHSLFVIDGGSKVTMGEE